MKRSSVVSDQSSIVSDQLSVVSDQLSVVSDQLSVVSDQSSIVSDQSSVISDQSAVSSLWSLLPAPCSRPLTPLLLPLAALLLALSSPPCLAQSTNTAPSADRLTTNANLFTSIESLDDQQKLGAGDRVSFRVIEDKEESKSLVVTDSGEMEIPYLGRVNAANKTCQGLAKEIKAALEKDLYYKATVILAIDQLNRKRGSVYLVGQVRASGPVDIPSDEVFTVSKAILRAGGFGDFADKKHVKITRKAGGSRNRVIMVDLTEILEKGQTEKDTRLESGDLIFVPSRLFNF